MKSSISNKSLTHRRVILATVVSLIFALVGTAFTNINTVSAQTSIAIPASYKIDNMPVFAQQRTLSCEYAATRAAVGRWGGSISEAEFINAIPVNPNPHIGYRGNINGVFGGTVDYGIYGEPIALVLATKGFNAKMLVGELDELKSELAKGRPVVVWVPSGMGGGYPYTTTYEGATFKLMAYEHAMTAYGYNENGIYMADPGFGTYDFYSWSSFTRAWAYLDNMAMSVWPANQPADSDESLGISPYFYRQWLQDGGLEIYGYPISAPVVSGNKQIQYFERARMEYDLTGPRNQAIALGLLGRELTANRTNSFYFRPIDQIESTDSRWYFSETGHSLGGAFLPYWRDNGGIGIFGFPISEPFAENGQLIQYFERSRIELVPGTSDQITLGLLGRESLASNIVSRPYNFHRLLVP